MKKFQLSLGSQTLLRESESQTYVMESDYDIGELQTPESLLAPGLASHGVVSFDDLIACMYNDELDGLALNAKSALHNTDLFTTSRTRKTYLTIEDEAIDQFVCMKSKESLHASMGRFETARMEAMHKMDQRLHRTLNRSESEQALNVGHNTKSSSRKIRKNFGEKARNLYILNFFGYRIPKLPIPKLTHGLIIPLVKDSSVTNMPRRQHRKVVQSKSDRKILATLEKAYNDLVTYGHIS